MSPVELFFNVALSVDNVIFGFDEGDLKILLIKRGEEPFNGYWALPGHYVFAGEDLDTAARRVLEELTGIRNVFLEQVETFGATDRHPFGRVVTVAYFSLIKIQDYQLLPSSMAEHAAWHSIKELNGLAFDHNLIFKACLKRLKLLVKTRPIGFELLPPQFTLTQLQHLYESILEDRLDKRNFRKKFLAMNVLIDLGQIQNSVAHRPARLFSFDRERYLALKSDGFVFEFKQSRPKSIAI
jgi:8-oxo-dGTP diphosphatase